ncbi:MAG: hypothetical protein ACLQPD_05390 [Desulfomonilaceae bacterium]
MTSQDVSFAVSCSSVHLERHILDARLSPLARRIVFPDRRDYELVSLIELPGNPMC